MSRHYRSESDQSDRPTLPPIRDLFREELSQSPRPPHPLTNSPSFSFARLSFDDDQESSQQMADGCRSSHNHARRLDRPISHRSLPTTLSVSPSMTPRPSSTLPTHIYSETDRDITNRPLSRSFSSGHYNSNNSNDIPFRSGTPSNAAYQTSRHVTPSNALGLSHSSVPTVPYAHRSYSRGGSHYDPRVSRHADVEQMPIRESSESQIGGSSMIDRTGQSTPAPSSSVAKYECNYCGKGFNRPSSLKIHLNSHTGEKPFTCPFDGCGRSFSVLSNMRRHARVHASAPRPFREDSSDEGSDEPSPPLTTSSSSPLTPAKISPATPDSARAGASASYHARRDSSASRTNPHRKSSSR